ncbi:hypothetical protein ACEPAF_500 [Sanghuangporus sanghuang]
MTGAAPSSASPPRLHFKHSGFTHTLFFDCSPSTNNDDRVLQDLKNAIKQGEKRDNAGETEDEKYGLYYYNVFDKPVERRPSNSIRRLIPGSREPKRDYSEQVREGYEKIVKNYEREGERDYICVFGVGEGVEPALLVARILSKVGVIQAWAFKENFSLVLKLTTSNKYNDEQRENFRSVRTQFAAVDLFCLDGEMPEKGQLGDNVLDSRRCGRDELPDKYKSIFPAPASQHKPEKDTASQANSTENIAPLPKNDGTVRP